MLRRRLLVFVASGAYLGYAPVASGTVGTLYGVAFYPVYHGLRQVSVPLYVLSFVALVAASIWIADQAETIFAEKDSGKITIDELAGYITATMFIDLTLATLVASFLLFRLFDVLKLWPAYVFDERVPGGIGVVMDDVFAGLYANLSLRALFWALGQAV